MDLRQIHYFCAVLEQGSVSAAARVCGVSQPAISLRIRQLESELNETLFVRAPDGLRPVAAGTALYRRLAPIVARAAHGLAYIRAQDDRPLMDLRVAVDQSAASLLSERVRKAGGQLESETPYLHVIHMALETGRDDGVLPDLAISIQVGSRKNGEAVCQDGWVLVEIGPGQEAREPGVMSRADLLSRHDYLDVPSLSNAGRAALVAWSRRGLPIPMTMTDDDANGLVATILARNRGQALVPRLSLRPAFLCHPRLAIRRLEAGLPQVSVVVQGAAAHPFGDRLVALIRQAAEPLDPAAPGKNLALPGTRQLKAFLTVLEEGSLSKAATRLNVVQPAISMQLRVLEQTLGDRLLDRTHRRVSPTRLGRTVQAIFHPVVAALQGANTVNVVERRHGGRSLRVGLLPGLDEDSLLVQASTATVLAWRNLFPNIELHVVEAQSGVLLDWLADKRIDIAIVEDLHGTTAFRETILSSEPLAILVRSGSALCEPGPIGIDAVGKLSLVLPSRRHGLRALLDRTFAEAGLRLVPQLQLDSMASAMRLVRAGGWATVMPASAVRQSLEDGSLIAHFIVRPEITRDLRAVQARAARAWESEFIKILRSRLAPPAAEGAAPVRQVPRRS